MIITGDISSQWKTPKQSRPFLEINNKPATTDNKSNFQSQISCISSQFQGTPFGKFLTMQRSDFNSRLSSKAASRTSDRKVSQASVKNYNLLLEQFRNSVASKDPTSKKEEIRISVMSMYRERMSEL